MKKAELREIRENFMGTISFEMKSPSMRKFQEFIVYPVRESTDRIIIQSDKRIGFLSPLGEVKLSKNYYSGAYFHHLSIGKLTEFVLEDEDWQKLKEAIISTSGDEVGKFFVKSDNSAVKSILK